MSIKGILADAYNNAEYIVSVYFQYLVLVWLQEHQNKKSQQSFSYYC